MTAPPENEQRCRMCGNAGGNRAFRVREMMFGTREAFGYFECGRCGTLQIAEVPGELARHYPAEYYAFRNQAREKHGRWEGVLKRARARHAIEGKGVLGGLVAKVQGSWPYFEWFRAAGVSLEASILDVGCGRGDYLLRFASDGFTRLTGVDPYVESDITFENGVRIYRRTLGEMTGEFDCVFCRHAFEHMPDPREALGHMARLTRGGGAILIAIPVAQSWAWEAYGEDWYQLDAPRHLVIPSRRGMEMLAGELGRGVEGVHFDSTEEQMVVSELYRRGVALTEYAAKGAEAFFGREELEGFRERARDLNAAGRGDQACFILRRGGAR